ncbi:PRD domain-containing protein [Tetragenococcus koreensis]|uniref:Transcriptional antiterminator n=1 Tax=Tetragenococcus koreensis TaxID=290335 RepID=A0AAN4UE03_9ENTE|nr:PRD domain-containing protein [Tetragenococcus koreensis]AYW46593.1 transcription antiterminator BglG [Tetragenococcus koreensis]MCF1585629.1 PRD domain-containing protein [Tetragenococcus koreensis]MCF1615175.1 PRD domain-containing protein [Tetragenococcus koreensis]MCF1617882.1 PRD domain-containing protein [Tetragenococcus koreensis]MCF1620206.1 PRD domain-containing protein [Tetragenococcus koreensis]
MLTIKKVLNSSVVLATKDGAEMIVLGKGIGFARKKEEQIDENDVDKIFIPLNESKNEYILELIDDIPLAFFELTKKIVSLAEENLNTKLNNNIFLTLTDHLHFALDRYQNGINIANRLYWEIKNYYPKEYAVSTQAVEIINQSFDINLPQEEAANIAFHLINAQSESESTDSLESAKMIGGIVNMVRYSIQTEVDEDSVHYLRFITHVKYFVERFYTGKLMDDEGGSALYKQMWTLYPSAMEIGIKVQDYLYKMYDKKISEEEVVYLGVHINRLMNKSS